MTKTYQCPACELSFMDILKFLEHIEKCHYRIPISDKKECPLLTCKSNNVSDTGYRGECSGNAITEKIEPKTPIYKCNKCNKLFYVKLVSE